MVLDILIPTDVHLAYLVPDALQSIREFTNIPHKIIITIDGGNQDDILDLRKAAATFASWQIEQDDYGGYNKAMISAMDKSMADFVAVIPPETRMEDKRWFEKMYQPFSKDASAAFADAFPDTLSNTVPPGRRGLHNLGKNVKVFMSRKRVLAKLPKLLGESDDPVQILEREAFQLGGTIWSCPGVKFYMVKAEKRCLEQDVSEEAVQSESPWWMTRDSSSQMTTEPAGSRDFEV